MFAPTVTVTVTDVDYDYALISVVSQNSQRSNASVDLGTPDYLRISHESKGKGINEVDRHLVRIDTTKSWTDSSGSPQKATVSAYVVLVVPRSGVSVADAKLAFDKLSAFMSATEDGSSATNFERILAGEP